MKKISVKTFNIIVIIVEIIAILCVIAFWILVFMALIKFIKGF